MASSQLFNHLLCQIDLIISTTHLDANQSILRDFYIDNLLMHEYHGRKKKEKVLIRNEIDIFLRSSGLELRK